MKAAVIGGVVSGLTTWALTEFGRIDVMKHLLSLLTTFLPVWVGLIGFAAVWVVRDYCAIRGWLSIKCPRVEEFRDWLRSQPAYGYEAMVTRSMDDRILAMLNWWGPRPPIEPGGPKGR